MREDREPVIEMWSNDTRCATKGVEQDAEHWPVLEDVILHWQSIGDHREALVANKEKFRGNLLC